MTDFPILDAPRYYANLEHQRVILDYLGYLEPYIDETDDWVSMPVRLVHDAAGGLAIEVGPYKLDAADIRLMQSAIASYYQAAGRPLLRAIETGRPC